MKVSVITINYNNASGLNHTIHSVKRQSHDDHEFIVIDGGSTDGSLEVIKENHADIDYWVSEKDNGIYHAMNKGVAQAHGDYCIFMNSGDVFYDDNVLESICCKDFNEDVIIGKVAIDEQGHIISPPPVSGELTLYHLYSGAIPHQGSFIKTELLRTHPYDESLKISSDWKFFVQTLILDNCSVRYVDLFVACYDMNGISSHNQQIMRHEKEQVLAHLFSPRVLADYRMMKNSECLTQSLTPQLHKHYRIDKLMFLIGRMLLRFTKNEGT